MIWFGIYYVVMKLNEVIGYYSMRLKHICRNIAHKHLNVGDIVEVLPGIFDANGWYGKYIGQKFTIKSCLHGFELNGAVGPSKEPTSWWNYTEIKKVNK